MSNPPLDLDAVRAWFPAFDAPTGAGWAFFENAGSAYVPRPVIDRLTRFMIEAKVQPGAPFPASALATRMMADGVAAMAALANTAPESLVIGADTSTNLHVLANALACLLAPGDEIVVTNLDHESNITPWRRLTRTGATLREWQFDPETGALDVADLEALLTENTRLVCLPHASNITGAVSEAARAVRLAHEAGALAVVDGVSFAPHALVDVAALDADAYTFSAYKVFGPHVGVMALRPELLGRLENQNHMFLSGTGALTLNPGGPSHELCAALGGVTDYLEALDRQRGGPDEASPRDRVARCFAAFEAHQTALTARLLDGLAAVPEIRIIGSPSVGAHRSPTVAFTHATLSSRTVAERLGEHRVAVRHGAFYAWRAVHALGLDPADGIVRASLVHYNTADEVDRLLNALPRA
ncbi:cysteine desulfurase-like protein [Roseospira marina]|uniref:Cysteine desulfurase-like protein n=1 Tax=Roseospira marina TaxID=140057 RepID=A0A5M6IES6_9PROT|nr:cysteine desulfurase-like protein [Roseospira marina]KAA5606764.1 cysteine desulfurase-like protein [Roseospira marina]MBB4313814.1 cysteine desulfurase family protein (TIGR01976 family) [Roseospira marina]MBB5086976.1 cysteine desulfurase family protein (TIGR01976 family) [Roseospira marina]